MPRFADHPTVLDWLMLKSDFGNADNTIVSYSYVLSDYLAYCAEHQIDHLQATPQHLAGYFRALTNRPIKRKGQVIQRQLSNSSRKHRLSVLLLYYIYLKEQGIRGNIPIPHGFSAKRRHVPNHHGELPVKHTAAWIPDREQWERILRAMQSESLRNQLMLSLAFECSLRRAELCALQVRDVMWGSGGNMLCLRAETTKTKSARRVYFSEGTKRLLLQYLNIHHAGNRGTDAALFVSESKRNRGDAITVWAWVHVVKGIAQRTRLPRLTTHTMRHLGISAFAAKGWHGPYVSLYAGHKNQSTTALYTHPWPDSAQHSIEQAVVRLTASNPNQPQR